MEVMKLLDEMEELVEDSGRIPLTGKVIIESEDLLDKVDRIRSILPEELRQAQWINKSGTEFSMKPRLRPKSYCPKPTLR